MDFADFALFAPIFADSRGFNLSRAILQDFESNPQISPRVHPRDFGRIFEITLARQYVRDTAWSHHLSFP